jgi:hypothetical protein
MKATISWLGALLGLALLSSAAQAQCCYVWPPSAPDMCGPGFYSANCYGLVYGPGYSVQPPFPPFQGMVFGPKAPGGGGGMPTFPSHPFARSPRDYFMIDFEPPPYR